MNIKGMSTLIVTLIVGVLMVTTILIPIIQSSETTVVSTANNENGTYTMFKSPELGDYTIVIGNSSVTVNGEVVADNSTRSFVISDAFVFRSNDAQCYGADSINTHRVQTTSMTITISDGTFSYIDNDVEYSGELSFLILPDPDGNLGFFQNTSVYVTKDTPVYYVTTGGYNADPIGTTPNYVLKVVNGEIVDSLCKMVYAGFGIEGTSVYEGEYSLTGIYSDGLDKVNEKYSAGSFVWTPTSGENTAVAPYIIAPIEYQYISENDGVVRTLLEILPIFAIIGLVVGMVVMFRWRD